ncbi:DUF1049 domain-containing protein [Paenibacillus thalictri]|uniref:DUF1049 domain-containing protein n=2 Tax=Paenibacillus thalictri TaxID=2527873 RepID=A0A4Q9DYC8_9BACL|nr:lipopolysaccharide assembly protein LapA domain-containing protein [Paenibacillus thalictri]TBL81406.1 DUF1049 domain-containing protein [Paenibacillus thalictri]
MKTQWILICCMLFALLTAVFAVINVDKVKVNFLFAQPDMPLILVILGSTLLGGLIVGAFGMLRGYKMQRTIRQQDRLLQAWKQATGLEEPPIPAEPSQEQPHEQTTAPQS